MIFWESDLNFVTVLLDAINLGHLLLQKPNGAGDRRVHAATILVVQKKGKKTCLGPCWGRRLWLLSSGGGRHIIK